MTGIKFHNAELRSLDTDFDALAKAAEVCENWDKQVEEDDDGNYPQQPSDVAAAVETLENAISFQELTDSGIPSVSDYRFGYSLIGTVKHFRFCAGRARKAEIDG